MKNLISFLIKILVINFFIGLSGANADDVLKIYSERQPMLIEPLLNEFESQTGINVEWIYSKKGLVQKIILEKEQAEKIFNDIANEVSLKRIENAKYFDDHLSKIELILNSKAVVTATKLYEGQPTLLCEASSLGIPSIFPNTGGINEFFPKGYNLSFEQYDYEGLKTKLMMIRDTNQLTEIGIKNKNFLNLLLDNEKMASTFNKLYEQY